MKNTWVQGGNTFSLREVSSQVEKLPIAVYKIEEDPFENIFLTQMYEKFSFPYKIYGKDDVFVKRVEKTWNATTGNLGVLLNGIRGTGKTVTAQQICNLMNMPVLILPRKYKHMLNFLNEIQQDFILFIDEYEKIFDRNDPTMLTIMDGVMKTTNRILFLLTTNSTNIEANLLQRPSRIRYVKEYTDLDLSVITEIVDDMLVHTELKQATIKMIGHLPMITIDLVKAVIEEVNIHNEDPEVFKSFFNADDGQNDDYCNIYIMKNGAKEFYKGFADVGPNPNYMDEEEFENAVGQNFYINDRFVGHIKSVISNQEILVTVKDIDMEASAASGKPVHVDVDKLYICEQSTKRHKSFKNFAF